jgi:hypothetical protein
VAGALREGKLDEAIRIAERNKKSHIAKVVASGLADFQASSGLPEDEVIEASKRGLERSVAITHAELKRGLGGLATIGATAPFVGLFGTVIGIINAFRGIQEQKATGLTAVAGGIAEALVATALGLQLLHHQDRSLRRGDGQQLQGADQLLHPAAQEVSPREGSHGLQTEGARHHAGHQRGADGRHHAGAADHFHGGHAHAAERRQRRHGQHGKPHRDA